ncbi:MAG: hypothetical protein GTO30_10420 [Acidobacteria bacterium]|nr:hypothetical protein [Acidobacteriota bacterium]NIM62047.1 hypothetical protein [Acidobacteriota bacterium]NIQ85851.1 hypothetical protein [Acidobacteriota bacterium]NIT11402.1 hypothetical protein [Acidobacteriota bacterium]
MERNRVAGSLTALSAAALLFVSACDRPPRDADRPAGPRLVVLLVIDQMRADRLLESSPPPGSGRARLLVDGRIYENAHHAHAYTWTAAGHASMVSGVHPSRHGIIGNSWWERPERRRVRAAVDPGTRLVDLPEKTGRSGFRLRVSTLGDWLKEQSPASQVWAVSIKDRAAAIVAGKTADGAFWYDFDRGRFVTSDYYMEQEPAWAVAFDESRTVEAYRDGWDLLDDPGSYERPDDAPGEPQASTFPHPFSDGDAYYPQIYNTPFGDQFTFEFVAALIEGQQLGKDAASDLLIVSASTSDQIGHIYGPWSREIEDYDRRLDNFLNALFDQLDAAVGVGRWLVALTSDHGVVPVPEQTPGAARIPFGALAASTQARLDEGLEALGLDPGSVRLDYVNGVVLDANPEVPAEALADLRTRLAARLTEHPRIEDVFTWDELASETPLGRPYEPEFRRSFDPSRSADLMVRFREFDLISSGTSGANHGSVYTYDTHVPLVFLGAGVTAGRVDTPVWTVDLAPTLAGCLGIEPPAGLDGEIRLECSPAP